jgi:hypothetical protein
MAHNLLKHLAELACDYLSPHQSTGIIFEPGTNVAYIGSLCSLEIPSADALRVFPTSRRTRRGGHAVFCITPTRAAIGLDLVASAEGVIAQLCIERPGRRLANPLYSVEVVSQTPFCGCIDIVVPIPADSEEGAKVVLRKVSITGCNVELGETPVQVTVGFNHEPASAGRVLAAAYAGDVPALTQALDDGGSTQESNVVRV